MGYEAAVIRIKGSATPSTGEPISPYIFPANLSPRAQLIRRTKFAARCSVRRVNPSDGRLSRDPHPTRVVIRRRLYYTLCPLHYACTHERESERDGQIPAKPLWFGYHPSSAPGRVFRLAARRACQSRSVKQPARYTAVTLSSPVVRFRVVCACTAVRRCAGQSTCDRCAGTTRNTLS